MFCSQHCLVFIASTRTITYWHLPSDRKNSRYSEKDAAVVVRQMLKVAAECHLRGLVHRDMKPEVEIKHFQCVST